MDLRLCAVSEGYCSDAVSQPRRRVAVVKGRRLRALSFLVVMIEEENKGLGSPHTNAIGASAHRARRFPSGRYIVEEGFTLVALKNNSHLSGELHSSWKVS